MTVKEVIVMLEADGWRHIRTKGSHRQFKHPNKIGTVTVAGADRKELTPGIKNSIYKQAGWKK